MPPIQQIPLKILAQVSSNWQKWRRKIKKKIKIKLIKQSLQPRPRRPNPLPSRFSKWLRCTSSPKIWKRKLNRRPSKPKRPRMRRRPKKIAKKSKLTLLPKRTPRLKPSPRPMLQHPFKTKPKQQNPKRIHLWPIQNNKQVLIVRKLFNLTPPQTLKVTCQQNQTNQILQKP